MNLSDWIERHAAFTPDKPAIRFEGPALLPGSGSGWPIVRELASRLGGRLSIVRRPGGISIGVDLPIHDEPAVVAAPPGLDVAAGAGLGLVDSGAGQSASRADLWLVDVDAAADLQAGLAPGEPGSAPRVAATWERGGDFRRRVARHARYLIYKPVTADKIRHLAGHVRCQERTPYDV